MSLVVDRYKYINHAGVVDLVHVYSTNLDLNSTQEERRGATTAFGYYIAQFSDRITANRSRATFRQVTTAIGFVV